MKKISFLEKIIQEKSENGFMNNEKSENRFINKEKLKQIVLITVAFVCIGIGCFNFQYQQKSIEVSAGDIRNELNLGDVQLVNSEAVKEDEQVSYLSEIVPNEEIENIDKQEELASTTINEKNTQNEDQYFIETKLQRDVMYSEMIETYQKMLENPDVGETQKAIAAQEISNINHNKNGIMIAENLIKNKGFEDVVILVNSGAVSVVVKSPLLNQEQIAKIQNIVSRELNVELPNIHISKK